MKYNDVMPKMKVDPETYVSFFCPMIIYGSKDIGQLIFPIENQVVEADGKVCKAEPASQLPLAQAYYVY